jgi:hypothetical protein
MTIFEVLTRQPTLITEHIEIFAGAITTHLSALLQVRASDTTLPALQILATLIGPLAQHRGGSTLAEVLSNKLLPACLTLFGEEAPLPA